MTNYSELNLIGQDDILNNLKIRERHIEIEEKISKLYRDMKNEVDDKSTTDALNFSQREIRASLYRIYSIAQNNNMWK